MRHFSSHRSNFDALCGCFPTGRHYPGIADLMVRMAPRVEGLSKEFDPAMEWAHLDLVIIDFETTGLDPERDRILEIGTVAFRRGELLERRNWLVNPGIAVPEQARKVHGIGDDELAHAPLLSAIFGEVRAFLNGRLPVAYNADFDRSFLHRECERLALEPQTPLCPALDPTVTWVDPLVWARELHRYEKGRKLSDVCARLGIALETAHRAASDAEAAGRVLFALAPRLPRTYGELIRLQRSYAARQEAELQAWRARRST